MASLPKSDAVQFSDLYGPVAADLDRVREVFRAELASDQAFIDDLCDHVSRYHGKMLRPALVLLCGRALGSLRPAHFTVAAVTEMVHIATLVHDDILDDADTRRRVATVNHLVGNERAVLLGDFLISHAFHLCSSLESQFAARRIGATTNEVCEGEMMQVANRENLALSEGLYTEIIKRKTASLIGVCCELGAWCSDADADVCGRMRQFGISLGVAFQIVDDILDLTGEERLVGKNLGRDLEKGKLTLPLIHLLGVSAAADVERWHELLAAHEAPEGGWVAALEESGSLPYARRVAARYVDEARAALEVLPAGDARDALQIMADFVVARQR